MKEIAPFKRLLAVIEALPGTTPDDVPLRDVMPGVWPSVGDLRRLVRTTQKEDVDGNK